MLSHGFDWSSYSCEGWAEEFGTSYIMLDGGNSGGEAWSLFGDGYIPHHVVIDHNKEVLYTDYGSNISGIMEVIEEALLHVPRDEDQDGVLDEDDNCFDAVNPDQEDVDLDGFGDACDICDNLNVYTLGNVDGTVTIDVNGNYNATVNIIDVLSMADLILEGVNPDIQNCGFEASDFTYDGEVNVIDVISLVQFLINGEFDNSLSSGGEGNIELLHSDEVSRVLIESNTQISGFQFEINQNQLTSYFDPEDLVIPNGWHLNHLMLGDNIKILAYDPTGENSVRKIDLNMELKSISSLNNIIVGNASGAEVEMSFSEKSSYDPGAILPSNPGIKGLFPNPFNPKLSIAITVPNQSNFKLAIYNTLGELVDVLFEERSLSVGDHTFYWNAEDHSSGMYFVKIESGNFSETKKALFLK